MMPKFSLSSEALRFQPLDYLFVNGDYYQQSINVKEYSEAVEDKIAKAMSKHIAGKIIISLLLWSVLCTFLLIIRVFAPGTVNKSLLHWKTL